MTMRDFDAALKIVENNEGDFIGGIDESVILAVQKKLGIKFPPTYCAFLKNLGYGDIYGHEFYGIISTDFENSGIPDGAWITLKERKQGLPENLFIIYANGDGTYCAIDTHLENSDQEGEVFEYGIDGTIELIAEDFGEFFLRTISEP